MIDWDRVTELKEEFGADGFGEVATLFLDEVADALVRLSAATGCDETLAAELHFLKGSALNLGFSELADMCRDAETAIACGDAANVDVALIAACFDQSRATFAQRVTAAA